jgi:hypothetical protein
MLESYKAGKLKILEIKKLLSLQASKLYDLIALQPPSFQASELSSFRLR